ncbi:hypothetical protein CR513_20930, partial [Mucuna pruriens]
MVDDAYMEVATIMLEGPITEEGLRGSKRKYNTFWPLSKTKGKTKKSKYIIDTMNKLRGKLDLVGNGLDLVQKDVQSTNDKVKALSRAKEDGSRGGNYSDHSRSSWSSKQEMCKRHERNKREERHVRRDRRDKDRRDELDISMKDLMKEFSAMSLEDISLGLPPLRGIEHHIDLSLGGTLSNKATYKMNPEEGKEIQKQVRESMNPCSMLVILVPQKDDTWRMCTNYRPMNDIIVRYMHLISRLDDLLDELHDSQIFSKIDFKSGYYQIRVREGMNGKQLLRKYLGFMND